MCIRIQGCRTAVEGNVFTHLFARTSNANLFAKIEIRVPSAAANLFRIRQGTRPPP